MSDTAEEETQTQTESVPYSKYVGVKESLGRKIAKLETENETLRTAKLQAEAKVESLEEQNKTLLATAEKPTVDVKEYEAVKKELEGLQSRALEERRAQVATTYKLAQEKVATLTSEQLDTLESVLKTGEAEPAEPVPAATPASTTDFSGGAVAPPKGSVEMFKQGFEAAGVK